MVEQIVLVVHVLIAIGIVGLILLQQGKGADMGASFGAGSSQTLFGATGGGNVLTRATAILVTLFFVSSLGLAIIAKQKVSQVGSDPLLIGEEAPAVPDFDVDAASLPEDVAEGLDTIPAGVSDNLDLIDDIPE